MFPFGNANNISPVVSEETSTPVEKEVKEESNREYCNRMLVTYGKESDIPITDKYWRLKHDQE